MPSLFWISLSSFHLVCYSLYQFPPLFLALCLHVMPCVHKLLCHVILWLFTLCLCGTVDTSKSWCSVLLVTNQEASVIVRSNLDWNLRIIPILNALTIHHNYTPDVHTSLNILYALEFYWLEVALIFYQLTKRWCHQFRILSSCIPRYFTF